MITNFSLCIRFTHFEPFNFEDLLIRLKWGFPFLSLLQIDAHTHSEPAQWASNPRHKPRATQNVRPPKFLMVHSIVGPFCFFYANWSN
ncbi:hypothetical protein HanIR_Chr02g0089271 [Helianthus annuus]|nr:hypothetical protein HanIR_Chr02g0089271 [Helianthus annuus]